MRWTIWRTLATCYYNYLKLLCYWYICPFYALREVDLYSSWKDKFCLSRNNYANYCWFLNIQALIKFLSTIKFELHKTDVKIKCPFDVAFDNTVVRVPLSIWCLFLWNLEFESKRDHAPLKMIVCSGRLFCDAFGISFYVSTLHETFKFLKIKILRYQIYLATHICMQFQYLFSCLKFSNQKIKTTFLNAS